MGIITYRSHIVERDSPKTVVFFTGFRTEDDDKYEWWSFKDIAENVIFIRDISLTWYHACYEEIIELLKENITEKTLMVGASAGGYAALIFANALGKKSLAINPQTTLSIEHKYINKKWSGYHKKIATITKNPELLDIARISGDNHKILYSKKVQIDVFHATRMSVGLKPYEYKDHGLAEFLQKEGLLNKIIDEQIEEL